MMFTSNSIEIQIKHGENLYLPVVEGEVQVDWENKFNCGKITFNVVKDSIIDFQEGDVVLLWIRGMQEPFFYGYVFAKSRDKNKIIEVTAFDQVRYLKNKDSYQYADITYSEMVTNICSKHGLLTGTIEDTEVKLGERIEENKEWLEVLEYASLMTTIGSLQTFVLRDEGGRICLRSINNMQVKYLLHSGNCENFEYETSINTGVYNSIKVDYVNEDETVTPVIIEDESKIEQWGLLQYYAKDNSDEDVQTRAKLLLEQVSKKSRKIKVNKCEGNTDVRAGSVIAVNLDVGDIVIQSGMIVDKVTHNFKDGYHWMDLELINADFMGEFGGTDDLFKVEQKEKQEELTEGEVVANGMSELGKPSDPAPSAQWVTKTLTMQSTAYTDDPAENGGYIGLTAMGTTLRAGVVAVDPNVIPLGSKLYVEGYGYASAEDTGGAIKGNIIDVCFIGSDAKNRSYNWGRRTVTVYILSDYPPRITVKSTAGDSGNTSSNNDGLSQTQRDLVSTAKEYLGIPYVWGGGRGGGINTSTNPSQISGGGYDCSSFVRAVFYRVLGRDIGSVTTQQEYQGVDVTNRTLQAGDLIFWGSRGATYHVAMLIGNNQYIHAPQSGDVVKISTFNGCSVARRLI